MVEIQTLVDRSRAELPGAPVPLLNRIAVETARQLCRDGRLWRHIFTTDDGTLDVPDESVLHDIEGVHCNGRWLSQNGQDGWQRDGNAVVTDAHGALTVYGVLIPHPDTTTIPDLLYEEWAEAMEHGIKADAFLRPAEWGNGEMGMFHRRAWQSYRAKARSYGRNGGVTARRRIVDPWSRHYRAGA